MSKSTIVLMAMALMPSLSFAQRIQQPLGRSVVAVTDDSKQDVLVTWRKLAQEHDSCTYNLYKRAKGSTEYTKVNSSPIKKTNFQTTRSQVPYDTELAVTTVLNGVESEKSNPFLFKKQAWKDVFLDINFENTVLTPNNYTVKYAWPMDLDGNGEYDALLVDRLYKGGSDADPGCTTTSHKLQAYTFDGKCLWTVDMGPNVIIDGGQNDMVVAYDINCDGKCEVIVKSSDLTRFWDATNNTWGKYANGSATSDTDGDGIDDYTTQTKRNAPFYISVIDGKTGAEIECSELKYSEVHDGVDSYSRDNRSDYMNDGNGTEYAFLGGHFAICYFDGIHPSLAMECLDRTASSKTHHNYVFVWSYDWNSGKPSNWHHSYTWSRNDKTPWPAEFHQLRVADTDGDGIDEMLEGGYGVNPTKGMVFSAGIGHGDRYDVSDIDPDRPGMETFCIQQSNLLGQVLYDAATGEHIKEWYLPSVYDVGRGRCMDVAPDHKGYEIFSLLGNLYDCKGNVIKEGETTYPMEASWWDGNLQRELIGSPGGSGNSSNVMMITYGGSRLIEFSKQSSWAVHAGWAVRPAFMGDITGDWREEIILMKQNNETSTGIVGYSTNLSTDYSFYTLQEDPHYRLDCTTRGYYQAPCTSFYLGEEMPYPPLPPVMVTDLRWKSGSAWSAAGSGFTSFDQTTAQTFADGKSVVFDISGDNASAISIDGTLKPMSVYIMAPKGHDYTFNGNGTLNGDMELWKSMLGTATFNNNLNYTGRTVVSEGTLCVNGTIAGPIDVRAKGTLSGVATINGAVSFEGALNYEGCSLMPGSDDNQFGTMTFNKSLTIPGDIYIKVRASEGKAGNIVVNGDLTMLGTNTISVEQIGGKIAEGSYVIAQCTGTLSVDVANLKGRGLDGINYDFRTEGKQLILDINGTRAPLENVVWTGNDNNIWDYKSSNFNADGSSTPFVTDDKVVFDDQSANRNITLNDLVVTKGVTFDFDNGTYSLSGEGGISGEGGVTKNGKGEVKMDLSNSDYTGATVINGGTLTITSMADGGAKCAIGAATAKEGNLQINGGVLKIDADNTATDRIVTLTDTATINVANGSGSVSLKGLVKGSGYLVKTGAGQLNFNYGGVNTFSGLILRQGKVAQGNWQSTFGKKNSPMVLEGGEIDMISNNSMSTIPEFAYKATVPEGAISTVKSSYRCKINGSFAGKGTLTIVSDGVRSDIGSDFSAFEGTLNVQGGNFRLMSGVKDMAKTNVVMAAASYMGHHKSGAATAEAVATKIGSVSSTADDCTLGNSSDTYEVGYNNTDASYKGLLKAATVKKCGTGTWTLSTNGSTSNVQVNGGTLSLNNNPITTNPSAFTSGVVTVNAGGTLRGNGCAAAVIVKKGGTVAAGTTQYGTLKTTGAVVMQSGSTLLVKVGKNAIGTSTNDKFKFGGAVTHSGDTILIEVDANRELSLGENLTVFTGTGTQSGNYIIKTVAPAQPNIKWDDSRLLSEGLLIVDEVSAIGAVIADDTLVDVYTTDGKLLRDNVEYGKALDGLSRGVYVVNGRKVTKK
jgi:autotransporter-associated beta strand protein